MKKILIAILVCIVAGLGSINAQQTPLYSMYMHNPFILNPAIAGTYKNFELRLMSRLQWVGFPDAPVTNSLSFYGPVSKNKDMGYGATVYSDITSPTTRLGFKGAYAYNIKITDIIRASFAAALGFFQYKYDGTKIKMQNQNDPVAPESMKSELEPDGMLGALVWSSMFQAGLSVDNLFNNKFNVNPDQSDILSVSKLVRHYYIFGSYTWNHNRRWSTEYGTLVKAVEGFNVPVQVDLNVRAKYQKNAWFGLSYRTFDAISILGGYIFNKRIYAGYSLDINLSSIRQYSFGSHEIMLGYRFNTLR